MAVALINGKNFSHKQIIVNIGGVPVVSISNISITDGATREFSYGTSGLPVGYGDGPDTPVDFTFEISMTDFIALTRASPEQNLKRLDPFDIPITFLNPANPAGVIIKNVLVQTTNPSSDTDTTDIKISVTTQASHLVWK